MKTGYYILIALLFCAVSCSGQGTPVTKVSDASSVSDTLPDSDCDTTKVADFKSNLQRLNTVPPPAMAAYQDSIAQQFIDQACEDDELFCGELSRKKQQIFVYNPQWMIYLGAYVLDEGAGMEEVSASFFVLTISRSGKPWFSDVLHDLMGEIKVEVNGFEAGEEQVVVWGHAYPYFQDDYGKFRLVIQDGAGQYEFQCQSQTGNIPEDIKGKVRELFPDVADQGYILQKLGTLWQMPLNVGTDQLARGILVLSGSSRNEFDALFDGDFMGDPRDLLTSAEAKLGNPGHYCTEPFAPNTFER